MELNLYTIIYNDNTVINYCMYQNDSLLIKLENRETAPLCFKKSPGEVIKTINLFEKVNYERCEPMYYCSIAHNLR